MDVDQFIQAQNPHIDTVLRELRSGCKKTHWIWFIFPQLKGLGQSDMSLKFGLNGLEDAQAWLKHPILSIRLLDCTRALLMHPKKPISSIMEFPNDLKLHSSTTLLWLTIHLFKQELTTHGTHTSRILRHCMARSLKKT
jgi:uncharacterized protein (DUF1810 family)